MLTCFGQSSVLGTVPKEFRGASHCLLPLAFAMKHHHPPSHSSLKTWSFPWVTKVIWEVWPLVKGHLARTDLFSNY